jgi:iron complex transport system substrate-binding protein
MRVIFVFILFLQLNFLYAETIIDDVGRKIDIKLPISSIVSLSPAHTEMIYFLGQESKLKAVSVNCSFPKEAALKEKAGTFLNPDIEKILKIKPDIVISGGGIQKKAIKNLENLNIPVIVLYPRDIENIADNMYLLSFITGCKDCPIKIKNFSTKVKPQINKNIKIYMEIWGSPVMAVGGTSFINDLIKRAGAQNILNDTKQEYPKISDEFVIKNKPDIIILLYEPEKNYKEKFRFKNTPAGKKNQIFVLSKEEQDVFLRTGPRIVQAFNKLTEIINRINK